MLGRSVTSHTMATLSSPSSWWMGCAGVPSWLRTGTHRSLSVSAYSFPAGQTPAEPITRSGRVRRPSIRIPSSTTFGYSSSSTRVVLTRSVATRKTRPRPHTSSSNTVPVRACARCILRRARRICSLKASSVVLASFAARSKAPSTFSSSRSASRWRSASVSPCAS